MPYKFTPEYIQLSTIKKELEPIKEIANDAHKQALSSEEQILLLKQQLEFAKLEAASAKKEARFSKILSIISITISVLIGLSQISSICFSISLNSSSFTLRPFLFSLSL